MPPISHLHVHKTHGMSDGGTAGAALVEIDVAGLSFNYGANAAKGQPPEPEPEPEPEPKPEPEPEPEIVIPEGVPRRKSTFDLERERLLKMAEQPARVPRSRSLSFGSSRWATPAGARDGAVELRTASAGASPGGGVAALDFSALPHPLEFHGMAMSERSDHPTARLGTVKLAKLKGNHMSRSADFHNPMIRREVKISFSAGEAVVQEIMTSVEEIEQRREWNAESKKVRAANKAQIRAERKREQQKAQKALGEQFGTAAMPNHLISASSDSGSDSSGSEGEGEGLPFGFGSEESDDESQEVALVALDAARRHRSPRTAFGRAPAALEVAMRNSSDSQTEPSARSPRSILKPEPASHNWQRMTIWAGGIPEDFATEEVVALLFRAAFGIVASVGVRVKPTAQFGICRSWAFVTFAEAHTAARARLAGVLCLDPGAQRQLLPDPPSPRTADRGQGLGNVVLQLKEASIPQEMRKSITGALGGVWARQEQKLASTIIFEDTGRDPDRVDELRESKPPDSTDSL